MSTSPRILFVTDSLALPGCASQLKLLAGELAKAGFEIHIAAIHDSPACPTGLADHTIGIHPLNCGNKRQFGRALHQSIALTTALQPVIQSVRPDVVHLWNCEAHIEIAWATKGLTALRFLETRSASGFKTAYLRQKLEAKLKPAIEKTIVPHECLLDRLAANGIPADRCEIIPHAAPPATFDHATAKSRLTEQLGLPKAVYLAGTIAPLQPHFRLKDLVWATDLLSCIRNDFHFVIVGTGAQRERLERFVSQTEAKGHVHFIDQPNSGVTDDSLPAGLDVYWNSHLNNPLSSAVLHALAAGVPTISVLGAGTRKLIIHQQTGFAVNFGARDEFARWTKYLIERPESARQISTQCRQFICSKFPVGKMVEQYRSVYEP